MNPAMGVTYDGILPSPPYRTFPKLENIVNPTPAKAWVLIEEHPDSINDGTMALRMAERTRQLEIRIIDYPAPFHSGAANVSFADGHV